MGGCPSQPVRLCGLGGSIIAFDTVARDLHANAKFQLFRLATDSPLFAISKQYQPAHKPTHHWPCAMTAGAAGRRTGGSGRASPGARALGEASGRRSLHRLP
eukprot:2697864-Pyramimonas_sp.AAC.1